ncbi:hypothetical protein TSUD_38220 [Trifolium subterraneum]|uniref:FBD domain-containing protein n=1 Tax=Trifolium subterraneum TaxID=3900 RepID=A0A2Z6P754_TRISU|nr:hypothetical protein TSUD_38220 [Trifolium subterraneum]
MTLVIDAVHLLSLYCRCNPTIEFIPVNLTSIIDADIDLWCVFRHSEPYVAQCVFELLRGLNNVKYLTMSIITLQCLDHTKDTLHLLPVFHNLTHLYVESSSSKDNYYESSDDEEHEDEHDEDEHDDVRCIIGVLPATALRSHFENLEASRMKISLEEVLWKAIRFDSLEDML